MNYESAATLRIPSMWGPDDMPMWAREALLTHAGPGATGAAMSTYLANETLDHLLSLATFTAASPLYYALFTVSPTDAGGGNEVVGGSYTRQSVTNNATNFPAASGSAKSNGVAINFGTASANWGSVGYIALIDNSSGGNYYFWGALTVGIPILNGDSLSFPIGTITFGID